MKKAEFLHDVNNNDLNHRILLWEGLQLTSGKVVEFGSGHGSTPYLRNFCEDTKRPFESYDEKKEWCDVTGATMVTDWEAINLTDVQLLFIDHAPGERRQFDLVKYKDIAKVIVIHDIEEAADYGYQCRQHFSKFKYVQEIKTNGAGAAILSNHIDLTKLIGKGVDTYPYKIS